MAEGGNNEMHFGLTIDQAEIALLEKRVADIEKYLGMQEIVELGGELSAYEPLEKKSKKLDDFMKLVEDKHYIMGDLFSKYE